MKTIDFISLGCSKNLVDSENLMGMFEAKGYHVTHDSDDPQGEYVVVNTCGFIADAKEESINTILEQVAKPRFLRLTDGTASLIIVSCWRTCRGARYKVQGARIVQLLISRRKHATTPPENSPHLLTMPISRLVKDAIDIVLTVPSH